MKSLLCVILILFQLVLTSCNSRHENIIPSDGAESNEAAENTGAISQDIAPVSNGEIIGIETYHIPIPKQFPNIFVSTMRGITLIPHGWKAPITLIIL